MQEHSRPACCRRGRPQRRVALRAVRPTPVSASTSSTARDRRPQARASSAPTAASIAAAKAAAHEHAFELKLELVRAPHEPRRAGVPARRGLGSSAADASVARAVLSWAPEWRRRGRSDDAHGLCRAGDARGLGRPRCCHRGGGGGAGGGGGGGEQQGKGRSTSVSESLRAA